MTATLLINPNANGAELQKQEQELILSILPSAHCLLVTMIFAGDAEYKLPITISGELLNQIRPLLVTKYLERHTKSVETIAAMKAERDGQ